MNIQQIKDVIRDVDSRKIDDLILAKESLAMLMRGYDDGLLEIPDWVVDGMTALTREITAKSQAELELELRREEAELESLSTREERRQKKSERIAALKKKLGRE